MLEGEPLVPAPRSLARVPQRHRTHPSQAGHEIPDLCLPSLSQLRRSTSAPAVTFRPFLLSKVSLVSNVQ